MVPAITLNSWRASLAPPWNTKSPKNESLAISISARTIPTTRAIETETAGMIHRDPRSKSLVRPHGDRLGMAFPPSTINLLSGLGGIYTASKTSTYRLPPGVRFQRVAASGVGVVGRAQVFLEFLGARHSGRGYGSSTAVGDSA